MKTKSAGNFVLAAVTAAAGLTLVCGSAGAQSSQELDALGTQWSAFRSLSHSELFIRHRNFWGEVTPVRSELDRLDSSFRVVKGLAGRVNGQPTVSFEARNFPGYFLRHSHFRIRLDKNDGSPLFLKDASFKWRPALVLSHKDNLHSFESVNYPGYYIRQRAENPSEEASKVFHLYLEKSPPRGLDSENPASAVSRWCRDCTFQRVYRP